MSGDAHGSENSPSFKTVAVNGDLWKLLADNAKFETHGAFKLQKYSIDFVFCNPYETTVCRSRFVGILRDISAMKKIPLLDE